MLFSRLSAVLSLAASFVSVSAAPAAAPASAPPTSPRLDRKTTLTTYTEFDILAVNFGNSYGFCFLEGANVLGLTGESICLCIIPKNFLTSAVYISTESYVGSNTIGSITANIGSPSSGCQIPQYATPKYIAGYAGFQVTNQASCCDFVCNAGYVRCSGQCIAGTKCPSGKILNAKKRTIAGSTDGLCATGKSACAVPGLRGKTSYECVDTQSNLESCGGCLHGSADNATAFGQDCTSIVGVNEVSCNGSCVVKSCMPGYQVSSDGTTCIATLIQQKYRL